MFDDVVSNATAQEASPQLENVQPAPTDTEFLERFNKLSSREAMLRKRDQELRTERDSYKSKIDRLDRLEKLANENPEELLGEFGLNYDKLTERRLSGMGGEQEKVFNQMQSRLEQLEAKLSMQAKIEEEQKTTQSMQAAHAEIRRICESDDFELIRAQDAYDLVMDVAAEAFNSGRHITLQEAAKYTEAHLEKKLEGLLQAKKVTSRLSPRKEDAEAQQTQEQVPSKPSISSTSFNASSKPTPTALSEEDLRQAFWRTFSSGK